MFKILLLQRWYNLSDAAVEEALYDCLSFVRFVDLSLDHDEVPDADVSHWLANAANGAKTSWTWRKIEYD